MRRARAKFAPTDTLQATGKFRERLVPAKHTGSPAAKSTDDRFRCAHFKQDQNPESRATTTESSSKLKPLFWRSIKICTDQSHVRLEGPDYGQNIHRSCKSHYFKVRIASERLREQLVAHAVSIRN